jgi:WD40 repeat protein
MLKVRDGSYTSGNFGRVHEVLHGVPTHRLSSAPRRITFSPGGRQLTANLDQLRGSLLWNVERAGGRVNLHLTTNRLRENEIFFATNTTWVLNDRNHVRAFSLALAAPLGQTPEPLSTNDSSTVLARALTPDGRRLLLTCMAPHWATNAAFNGDHLQLWDLAERRRLAVWPHPGSDKNFGSGSQHGPLAFSPDGRRFALACFGGSGIEIWDTATGKRIHELHQPKPTYAWQGARPSVAAQIFRAVFRVKSGPPAPTPARHFMEASVKAIEFTPDSRLVVSCAEDRAVLRDVESGRELTQCRGATNMLSLAISPDGGTLATGEEDGHLRLWDLPSGRELAHWPAHNAAVTALAFSPDGETLASGARDATMKLWNLLFLRRELAKLGLDW